MDNLIGKDLGRYHIEEQLGQGGMATVYKARDMTLKRDVAIKIIRREAFGTEALARLTRRFEREARVLARLNHPHIVKIHDFGKYQGMPFLVMDYLPGITLKEIAKPLSIQQAAQLLFPIAHALAHAHQNGILHRDVKPSNVLITRDGEPMLADFGIAKILEINEEGTLTGTGMGVGTPEYMAPEQGLGKEVDARADIYALGIVFYELVTGRKPFTADTPMAVVFKQMTDPVPRPSAFVPDLPASVEQVIFHALEKKPENRFQLIESFAAVLEQLAKGETTIPSFSDEPSNDNALRGSSNPDLSRRSKIEEKPLSPETWDELEPQISKSRPLPTRTRPSKPNKGLILGIGLVGIVFLIGLSLIFRTLGSLTQEFVDQPPEVSAQDVGNDMLSVSEIPTPPSEMPDDMELEGSNDSEAAPIIQVASNVIQLSNISQLSETAHWSDENADLVAWLPDSQGFIAAHTFGGGFARYDTNSTTPARVHEGVSYIYPAAICTDGNLIALTDHGKELQIWQFGAAEAKIILRGDSVGITTQPVFSPDGLILAGILDNALHFWDTNSGSRITTLDENFSFKSGYTLTFSPDGRLFAAGNSDTGEIKVWEVETRLLKQTIHWHTGVWTLDFSPDSKTLASGSIKYDSRDIIRLWNIADGSQILNIQQSNEQVRDLEFSLDGQLLVSGMESGAVRVWRVLDGTLLTTLVVTDGSAGVVKFSPDGTQLITSGRDGIGLWGLQ